MLVAFFLIKEVINNLKIDHFSTFRRTIELNPTGKTLVGDVKYFFWETYLTQSNQSCG